MEGGRGRVCCFFVMAMAMAMLTMPATVTKTVTIDFFLLLKSNGMVVAIIYFSFFYSMKMQGKICGR